MGKIEIEKLLREDARANWREEEDLLWTYGDLEETFDVDSRVLQTLLDQPRWLEPRHLYDARGSELFEQITGLPEYYLTRTEVSILECHSEAIIDAADQSHLVEIGAGFSTKTRYLLDALEARFPDQGLFLPIDVSLSALRRSSRGIRGEFPRLHFIGLHASFEEALPALDPGLPKMVVFLGSSIGNLLRADLLEFFATLSAATTGGDAFLLGCDRHKDSARIRAAYDDSAGVTEEFILNVFDALNERTGSNFDRRRIRYEPRYNRRWRQMEMIVRFQSPQRVRFERLGREIDFEKDEEIQVEISRKFDSRRLQEQISCFGWHLVREFVDSRGWYSLMLFRRD